MNNDITRRPLSHNELHHILAEHARYKASEGDEGEEADLGAAIIEDYDFSGLDLSGINARGSVFTRCRFVGCDLYGTYFNKSSLIGADFRNANLSKAEFYRADVSGACFDNAKMIQVEFIRANLHGASFRNADINAYIISECDVTDAVFDGTHVEVEALV